jgi:DNA replication protein DnaC
MMEESLMEMQLRSLHLPGILANYRRLLGQHTDPLSYLRDLVALEATNRQEKGTRARITAARFPTMKTIESFDFSLQPDLPKAKLLEHLDGGFVEQHRNILLSGPPGVGKSHILSAIGLAVCMRGYRVLFTTAAALLMKLIDAKRSHTLERQYRILDRVDLILIDELGYIPFERESTDLLFQLISARYERRSIGLTTNLPFEKWTQVFPDEMTATAVIDRLIHHGSVFGFSGESHRLRTRGKSAEGDQTN